MNLPQIFQPTIEWIKEDYREKPLRFALELLAWMTSLGCAIVMALTIPSPPFIILYPLFMAQCGIFAWAAHTRKSTGMFANYCLLITIDAMGYARLLLS